MAEESSELDEIVQVASWHSSATTTAGANKPNTQTNTTKGPAAAESQNKSCASTSGTSGKIVVNQQFDDSTTTGFTTAPATSDDDYESDDDDDSRSNYSNNNTSNSNSTMSNSARHSQHGAKHTMVKGEEKRSHHNVLERKRRDLLKDSFSKLRDSVPTTQPRDRVSRAEILKQAADFIQSTVKRNAAARAELDELVRKNRELEDKKKADGVGSDVANSNETKKLLVMNSGNHLVVKQEH